jgi:hypothetical protein
LKISTRGKLGRFIFKEGEPAIFSFSNFGCDAQDIIVIRTPQGLCRMHAMLCGVFDLSDSAERPRPVFTRIGSKRVPTCSALLSRLGGAHRVLKVSEEQWLITKKCKPGSD